MTISIERVVRASRPLPRRTEYHPARSLAPRRGRITSGPVTATNGPDNIRPLHGNGYSSGTFTVSLEITSSSPKAMKFTTTEVPP